MENERKYAEEIRKQYQPKSETESKLEKLHKFDGAVRRPAEIFAYTFGVLGALILGVGMRELLHLPRDFKLPQKEVCGPRDFPQRRTPAQRTGIKKELPAKGVLFLMQITVTGRFRR